MMCCNNRQPYVHVRFHDQLAMWYQNSYIVNCDGFGGGLSFGPCGILWSCKYWAWWRSWDVAVIGIIPCDSDFGTSNKIGTKWGGRVILVPSLIWLIWGCHREVMENCALPGYYAASRGRFTTSRRAQFLATSRWHSQITQIFAS